MPIFDDTVEINVGWRNWLALGQLRNTGGGSFLIHNPWGNAGQPEGGAERNRLEFAYRHGNGSVRWGDFVIHGPTGNVGIGTALPRARLEVAGDIFATGDVQLLGADCAEHFVSAEAGIEPGTVMVLAEDGAVRTSDKGYDRRVVGVVAGAGDYRPGLVLDCRPPGTGEDRLTIALIGKAFCKVDAEIAAVEIGDLLTTADRPGHAMKAADRDRALGAVIGKALRPLRRGRGLVPILVALQ